MLDAPLTGALPDICAGLSSVLFSFDLDKEEFNQPLRRENVSCTSIILSVNIK